MEDASVEMEVCILAKVTATERGFKGEGVHDAELFVANDPSGTLFGFLGAEGAIDETENLSLLLEHEWENPLSVPCIIFGGVTIHEYVFFTRMPMQIAKK